MVPPSAPGAAPKWWRPQEKTVEPRTQRRLERAAELSGSAKTLSEKAVATTGEVVKAGASKLSSALQRSGLLHREGAAAGKSRAAVDARRVAAAFVGAAGNTVSAVQQGLAVLASDTGTAVVDMSRGAYGDEVGQAAQHATTSVMCAGAVAFNTAQVVSARQAAKALVTKCSPQPHPIDGIAGAQLQAAP